MFLKTLPLCTFNFLPRSSKWLQNYKNIMFLWAVKATNKIFTSYFLSKKSELFLKIISILLPLLFDTADLCLRNYSICWCNHLDHSGHNNFLSVSSLNDGIFPFPRSKHLINFSLENYSLSSLSLQRPQRSQSTHLKSLENSSMSTNVWDNKIYVGYL